MVLRFLQLSLFLLCLIAASQQIHAQPQPETSSAALSINEEARQRSLTAILQSIQSLQGELVAKQELLRSPIGEGRREEITLEIQGIVQKLTTLKNNFDQISSGVDPEDFVSKLENSEVDWGKDLRDILSPIVNEVRRLTSRPREIDRLRTQIEEFQTQLLLIDNAVANINKLQTQSQDLLVLTQLDESLRNWESRRQSIQTQLSISNQKLTQRLSERRGLGESVQNIFQLFFRSRGLNLLLATLGAIAFWIIFRKLYGLANLVIMPNRREPTFYARVLNVLHIVVAVLGTLLVFLLVLYFMGDWVLLILAIMFLLGVIWTSKQAVHQFWTHATMLLNVGTVREGERVIYNGVPWVVRSLNLYCNLVNPALTGGDLRLPVNDMTSLRSRINYEEEPWFPTKQGDWVVLADGTFGQVELQTPDCVQLRLQGGSIKSYPTAKFLDERPNNLSAGFRISVSFGVDYSLQSRVTSQIVEEMQKTLLAELPKHGCPSSDIENISVQFEEAGSSALNLVVLADLSGRRAADYQRLKRVIQAICVDSCTRNGWTIPFNQMTVHMAKG